ncbi:hypothetical protein CEXT_792701 [Caerostris extrusa]|uniref:Uncharacterized protein n=1 Tax=Caerostris extrusa TaxID=172846 RepID=A0AAV4NAI5_CAEEX|nr:hypothetical protein CEXT_792701 [Caerostris extrusa]
MLIAPPTPVPKRHVHHQQPRTLPWQRAVTLATIGSGECLRATDDLVLHFKIDPGDTFSSTGLSSTLGFRRGRDLLIGCCRDSTWRELMIFIVVYNFFYDMLPSGLGFANWEIAGKRHLFIFSDLG